MAAGKLPDLHSWWNGLSMHGPVYGYFVNPVKSWLIVKPEYESSARSLFSDTSINITSVGRCYLGSPIGSEEYIIDFVKKKVMEWVAQIERLAMIAQSQPQAAYSALTHGLYGKFVYLFRKYYTRYFRACWPFGGLSENEVITYILTGQNAISDYLRSIFSLPARLGGLGLVNPIVDSSRQFSDSVYILSPLVEAILQKNEAPFTVLLEEIRSRKNKVRANHTVPFTSKWTNTRGRLAGNLGIILSCPRNRVSLTAGRYKYRVHHALERIRASTVYARANHTTTT